MLKEIVSQMNDLFEGESLTDADKINCATHIRDRMLESATLEKQASANKKDQFGASPDFMKAFEDAVISAYENHRSMSEQVLSKGNVKKAMAAMLLDMVYNGFEEKRTGAN
jgi:type I restriction enzyme R subunit